MRRQRAASGRLSCGRYQLVANGAHELSATFLIGYDEDTLIATDSWSFALPTAVVNVIVD